MNSPLAIPPMLRDQRLILVLFISFRVMTLFAQQPFLEPKDKNAAPAYEMLTEGKFTEQGVTATGDFWYYYSLARFSDVGKLPYRDFWYEFPPVFPAISLTSYSLITDRDATLGSYKSYANTLALVMILFDAANLWLLRKIGTKLHGAATGITLSWIYVALAVPFLNVFWNFEPIVAFSILLSINFLIQERDTAAPLAMAFGALTKLFPLILLAATWRFRPIAVAVRHTVIAGVITGAVLLGVVAVGGPLGVASLNVQFNKASYQTIWALIDNNHKTGLLNPDHFNAQTAYMLEGNPSKLPWWLRIIPFGLIGLFVYTRTRRMDNKGIVAFVTVTVVLFFLWSQGWSPQWLVTLFPLVLLCFPSQNGVLLCITLAFLGLAEFPILFTRGIDPATEHFKPEFLPFFATVVIVRFLLLSGLAAGLYRILRVKIARKSDTAPSAVEAPQASPA